MEMDKSSTELSNFAFFPPHWGKTAVKTSWIYLNESAIVSYLRIYRDSW